MLYSHNLKSKNLKAFVFLFFSTFYFCIFLSGYFPYFYLLTSVLVQLKKCHAFSSFQSFFAWKNVKKHIQTSIRGTQNPNTGRKRQQLRSEYRTCESLVGIQMFPVFESPTWLYMFKTWMMDLRSPKIVTKSPCGSSLRSSIGCMKNSWIISKCRR